MVLLDSISSISLAHLTMLPRDCQLEGQLVVICVHEDIRELLAVSMQLGHQKGDRPLMIGVINDVPVVGCDWPGFQQALQQHQQSQGTELCNCR